MEDIAPAPAELTASDPLAMATVVAPSDPDSARFEALERFFAEVAPRITARIREKVASRELSGYLDVATYAVTGGKKIRPGISVLTFRALGGTFADEDQVFDIACSAELLHQGSLILDDVVDQALARRGQPTVAQQYGSAFGVVAAGGLATLALTMACGVSRGQMAGRLVAEIADDLMTGNAMDVLGIGFDNAQYEKLLALKTASLFRAAAQWGAIMAYSTPDVQGACNRFGVETGLAYQVTDDVTDFLTTKVTGQRDGTLAERRIALPLIHLWENDADSRPLLEKFADKRQEFSDDDLLMLFLGLERARSIEYALGVAGLHRENALRALDSVRFPDGGWCPKHRAMLRLLPEYVCLALLKEVPGG